MYGINTLPYYTNTSMTPYGYARGGIAGLRPGYGFGGKIRGAIKSITKPVAKVLDKIVPNEIKPALPFIAAAVPFFGPALASSAFGMTAAQYAALAPYIQAGASAFSQLSQEGAAERGLNPVSLGLSALQGYLAAPGATDSLGAGKIIGNVGDKVITAADLQSFGTNLSSNVSPEAIRGLSLTEGSNVYNALQNLTGASEAAPYLSGITSPTFLQSTENLARSVGSIGAETLGTGRESFENIISGSSANLGKDFINVGKAYVPGALQASGELAYNAALDAQKKYQNELLAMGNLASANKQDQINYIRRAMVSAGFNEDEIASAITRSGFAGGGRVGYGLGSLVKPAVRGLKNMKNKVVDFISRMTDDIEIRTQTDYADDSGASFDIYITPKTERGKNTLDQISQMGLAEKFDDGRYFISDINLEEATMSLNERGVKASGVYEPTAKGEEFESFRTAGQGPYGADYYGYDRLKEGLRGPKRPPMDKVDYDTIPSPTDKPEGFAEGGLMNLKMGGMPVEMDLRAKGGFVPIGKKERADDVPARLSKNEFVFTAKAVRNAGGGDIRKGAKRMYQIMNQLEARA